MFALLYYILLIFAKKKIRLELFFKKKDVLPKVQQTEN